MTALIVLIILLILHFRHKSSGTAQNLDDLQEWIKAEMQTGVSKEQMKEMLRKNTDWTEAEFEKAYSTLNSEKK